jgi:hypothetical protein
MHRSTTTTNPIDVDWSQLHRRGAAGMRAGLITPRSQDQNLSSVFSNSGFFIEESRHSSRDVKHEQHFTGMAQRQRAGLITPRSQDQNLLPVFSNSGFFIEESRPAGR